jgi:mannosyltransferase
VGLLRHARELPLGVKADRMLLLVPTLIVALVGVLRVQDQPFWLDETITARVVNRSASGLASVLWDQESGMPGYYVAAWVWSQAAGNDTWLRLLSVVGGMVAVAQVSVLAKRWYGRRAACLASALLIANPFFLRMLTEARSYSWAIALAAVSIAFTDRLSESIRGWRPALLGFLIGTAASFHLFAGCYSAMVFLVAIASGQLDARNWRRLALVPVVAVLTMLPFTHGVIVRRDAITWLRSMSSEAMRQQAGDLLGGRLLGAVTVLGLLGLLVAARQQATAAWPALVTTVPSVILITSLLLVSTFQPMFLTRYMAPALPGFAIGAAGGLVWLADRLPGVARSIAGVVVVGVLLAVAITARPFVEPAKGSGVARAVEYVVGNAGAEDLLLIEAYDIEVLHFLGSQPNLDPAALADSDDHLFPPRQSVSAIISELRSAPLVYIIYWDGWPVEQEVRDLIAERAVSVVDFGETAVLELRSEDDAS